MKRILCFIFVCYASSVVADVKLPTNCEAGLPNILSTNLIKKSDADKLLSSSDYGQSNKVDKYWIAYSDREENTTYLSPGGAAYDKLNFNENVRIAKVSNGYALVYTEPAQGMRYPQISSSAKSRGWVPLSKLLLWKSCPTNDQLIYNKALIVMNLDEIKGQNRDMALAFKNPETKNHGQKLRTKLEFYFVMKSEGDLCLLARQYKMDGITDQVLYGWVNKSFFIPWNQRSCLEPNWNKEDAEYFAGKNITAKIYETPSLTVLRHEKPLGRKNKVDGEKYPYRLNPGAMRFPILDNASSNSKVYHCTAFAGTGNTLLEMDENDEGDVFIDTHLEEKKIINLIIVIDGTSSMGDFYGPMQRAIQEANTYFGSQNRIVRVGVVIFRDYTDGQYVTEVQPMTDPKSPMLAKFLTSGGSYGIKSSPSDHTWTEALYKGLDVALDATRMGYSPKNSNIMFVIGDCGNDLNDNKISQNSIVERMARNNIQLASFQVRNNDEQSFILFRKQMNEIVRNNMKMQYGRISSTLKTAFKEIKNGYEFVANATKDKNFYMGSSHYANMGKEMLSSDLEKLITNRYQQFNAVIDIWTKNIGNADVTIGGGDEDPINMEFLKTVFSADEIDKLKKNASLMGFHGYTAKTDESGRDYWKPVLYISSDEFKSIIEKLAPVEASARNGGSDRRPYVNAIKALIRAQVPDLSESEINDMSVETVMALIGGLNVSIGATNGRTLLQIQDENIVTQSEFDAMVQSFNRKYKKLTRILADGSYPFKVKRNNTTYYWLPVEDLP